MLYVPLIFRKRFYIYEYILCVNKKGFDQFMFETSGIPHVSE